MRKAYCCGIIKRWSCTAIIPTVIMLAFGCQPNPESIPAEPVEGQAVSLRLQADTTAAQTITLGDIDPDDPIKKVDRFLPLAEYLGANLGEFGITRGDVVIARDTDEMAQMIQEGIVDIYFDSAFPTLEVQDQASTRVIARRWKDGDPSYWSAFIAREGSGIDGVEDFAGKLVAFENPHSTSGFLLPAGTLAQRGLRLRQVADPDARVAADEVGYLFSKEDEHTVDLVLQGKVAGGAVSNEDFFEQSLEVQGRLVMFDRTMAVPRQLVSVGPGLSRELSDRIVELLVGLEATEEGRAILNRLKNTRRFDNPPPETAASLVELDSLMDLLSSSID